MVNQNPDPYEEIELNSGFTEGIPERTIQLAKSMTKLEFFESYLEGWKMKQLKVI